LFQFSAGLWESFQGLTELVGDAATITPYPGVVFGISCRDQDNRAKRLQLMQIISLITLLHGDVFSTYLSGEISELNIIQHEVFLQKHELRAWERLSDSFDELFALSREIACDVIDLNMLAESEPWKLL